MTRADSFLMPMQFGSLVRWVALFICLFCVLGFFSTPASADYDVSTASGNLLLSRNHGGDGSAWGKTHCGSCHFIRNIHKKAPEATRRIVLKKGAETCTGCHGTNGAPVTRTCTVCHNRHDLPASPRLNGRQRHDFTVSRAFPLGDGECQTCHLKSDMDGKFEPEVDLTPIRDANGELAPYASISDFCLRCHNQDHVPQGVRIRTRPQFGINDPLRAIENDYTRIDRHGFMDGQRGPYVGLRASGYRYPDLVECTDCHAMHGTRNRKLILDDSRKGVTRLNHDFRFAPFKVVVRNGNYSQLCVLCHQMENPLVEQGSLVTGNGLSGVHDVTSDCTQCHTHGEPVKGGL